MPEKFQSPLSTSHTDKRVCLLLIILLLTVNIAYSCTCYNSVCMYGEINTIFSSAKLSLFNVINFI